MSERMNPREKADLRDGVRSRKLCARNSNGKHHGHKHQSNFSLCKLAGASPYKENLNGIKEIRLDKTPTVENNEEKEVSRK